MPESESSPRESETIAPTADHGLGPEDIEAILRRRSREMAAADADVSDQGEVAAEVVVVRRGAHVLGFPSGSIREARRVGLCPLPGAHDCIAGLFHVRGQVHCAVDILPLLEAGAQIEREEETLAALVQGPNGLLGLRIDEVVGPRQVLASEIADGLRDRETDFVSAVTDVLSILDIEALWRRPELFLRIGS